MEGSWIQEANNGTCTGRKPIKCNHTIKQMHI